MYTLVEIAVSVGVLATLITALSACVCGCKNSNQKSELVGTAGVVKIRLDEEAPSPTPTTPASIKRASTQNSQRSLPEIPHPVGRHDSGDTASEIYATVNLDEGNKVTTTASASRDHPYEHAYAKLQNESHNITVEITPEQSENEIQIEERGAAQSAAESVVISASVAISGQLPSSQELPYITPPSPRPNTDNAVHFSGDSTDSAKGYTSISVREPLSNIRAQSAKPPTQQPHYATVSDDSDEMYAAIEEASVGEGSDTYAQIGPEPRRRDTAALVHGSHSTNSHTNHPPHTSHTPHAAHTSHTPHAPQSSHTPRAPHSSHTPHAPHSSHTPHAPHTSHPPQAPHTPHAIHASHGLTSHPPHSAHGSHASSHALLPELVHHARRSAPPEIGGSSSNSTHTRQASSSSCSGSTGALGSPKPEKRQANSPLPPPPPAPAHPHAHAHAHPPASQPARHQRISSTGDLHFNHDKLRRSLNEKHQRNNSCVSSSDFYGCNYPVEKHRFSSGDLMRPLVAKELNFDIDQRENPADNLYNSIDGPGYSDYSSADANTSINSEQRATESPSRNVEEMYAKVMKKSKGKDEPVTARKLKETASNESDSHTMKYRPDDPGYETIDRKKSVNHGYETIARKERKSSQNQDPGYETVMDVNKMGQTSHCTNNNLLKLNHMAGDSGPNSILSSDAGYEHISKTDNNASDSDPNYEVLRNQPPTPPYATIAPGYKMQPTYSTVNKRSAKYNNWPANNNDDATMEPNYESMSHDPFYTTGSESDPNYESVRPKDPNYESVNTQDPNYESLRCKDPKYESVRLKDPKYDSVRSKKDPNYESVKYFELSKKEPPYEKLHNVAAENSGIERSDSSAGYEKINVPPNRDSKSSINNGADGTVSDYFQV